MGQSAFAGAEKFDVIEEESLGFASFVEGRVIKAVMMLGLGPFAATAAGAEHGGKPVEEDVVEAVGRL